MKDIAISPPFMFTARDLYVTVTEVKPGLQSLIIYWIKILVVHDELNYNIPFQISPKNVLLHSMLWKDVLL